MRLLYLDQNHWNRLERVFHGLVEDPAILNIISLIQILIERKKLRIIIDINRKWETSQRENEESRRRITDLMFEFSEGYYVIPCFLLEEYEIRNYFYRKMGIRETDIRDLAISDDIGYLLAGRPNFTNKTANREKLKEANTLLNEYISRPEFVIGLFNRFSEIDESARQDQVNNAENARQPLREMEDNRQRKKYQIEQNFIILMRKIMKTYQLSDEFRGRISDEQRLYNALIVKENIPNSLTRNSEKIEFMKQFPLFYTHATLVNARDRNLARPIQPGDLIDIVSYVVPIVYFDFLVGENYFINLTKQEKLDQDFGCVLLNRLEDLEPELRGLL